MVASNLGRVRRARGLSLRALAEKLNQNGQGLNPDGLNRAEKGTRQVTVDELVALAAALDVAPNGLLFPVDARGVVDVTGIGPVSVEELWEWADGRAPLSNGPDPEGSRADQFTLDSRPRHLAQPSLSTPAGRKRFAREVEGKPQYEVAWSPDGEVEAITMVSGTKRVPLWPDEDDDR